MQRSTSNNSSIYQKIAEKRENLEKLREFKQLTSDLVNQLESIGDKLETMNEGTTSVALILSNWKSVIQSISLASMALINQQNNHDNDDNNPKQGEDEKFPEPLVRIKLDQLNQKDQDDDKDQEEEEDDDKDQEEEDDYQQEEEYNNDR